MSDPKKPALGFIMVTLFLDILGIGLLIPILPNLVKSFVEGDASQGSRYYGAFLVAYAVMQFFFSPILGSLSDRFGRRPVLLLSTAGAGLDYLVMGFAPSLGWLFVGRIIAGITGASIATATAYIADVTPPEKRAQNFGLVGVAFGLGFIAGPLLGGMLGALSLRLPFFVAAGLTLANCTYGFFVLPESLAQENRRAFAWSRANPVGALISLSRYPIVIYLFLATFFWGLSHRGLESTWVLFTGHRFGWDARDAGVSLAAVGIAAAIVQGALVRRVIPAVGERRAFIGSLCLSIVAFMLYGSISDGAWVFFIIPIGALGNMAGPALQAIISKAVPANEQGLLQGGLASVTSMTQMIGPVVATQLFGYFISADAPAYIPGIAFFTGVGFMFMAIAVAVAVFTRIPERSLPKAQGGSP